MKGLARQLGGRGECRVRSNFPNRHIPAPYRGNLTLASVGRALMVPILASVGLLLVGGAAQAASDAVLICQVHKITAAGNRADCLAGEQAKALQRGTTNPGKCERAFDAALAKADNDAAHRGAKCRYLDNDDGTISDLNTLLMWEKKDVPGSRTVHDSAVYYTWPEALVFAINLGLTQAFDPKKILGGFAGHTDWRLPTISELTTILDTSIGDCAMTTHNGVPPCIDPIFRNGVDSFTTPDGYWSSTTFPEFNGTAAWMVDFGDGVVNQFTKVPVPGDPSTPGTRLVRAVRGGR